MAYSLRQELVQVMKDAVLFMTREKEYPSAETGYSLQMAPLNSHIKVSFVEISTFLLPKPYATDCFDYDSLGFSSQTMCFTSCIKQRVLNQTRMYPFWTRNCI